MSSLADRVMSISSTYEAKLSEIKSLRRLIRRLASHPLFIVSAFPPLFDLGPV